ncbi:MAG: rRNA maturation RNase YbeY [Ignavibacteriales bacterium]|nr:rRNA maturation RNase YbeY [Ignavibacteriales bacterium]
MIEVLHQHRKRRFSRKETLRTVALVLKRESQNPMHVSIVFTNDRYMQTVHGRFLQTRRTTDVMSFPLKDGMSIDGEVYVNLDQARRQSFRYGVPMSEEVRRLLIHGTLHLLGYRDATPRQRARMKRKEDMFLNILGRAG